VPGQDGPDIEEDEMYPITMTDIDTDRIREWHEQAARDRLVIQARRARREAAAAEAGQRRRRPWSRWWIRREAAAVAAQRVPADATPDQRASALSVGAAAERAGADDRQPVGGRAS
jgi:hypothetical protein